MSSIQERIIAEYGDGYDVDIVDIVGAKTKVIFICPDHGPFYMSPDNLIYNAGCPKCRGVHPRGYPRRRPNPRVQQKRKPGPKKRVTLYLHLNANDLLELSKVSTESDKVRHDAANADKALLYSKTYNGMVEYKKVIGAIGRTCPEEFLPVKGSNIKIKAIRSEHRLEVVRIMENPL